MTPGPGDGDPDEPPRPILGAGFWVVVGLGLICVLAGIAFAVLAPGLRAPAPHPAASPLGERHGSR